MVADELRRQADDFVELAELAPLIARNPSERTPRAAGNGEMPGPGEDVPGQMVRSA
jgi:hypothetical protein